MSYPGRPERCRRGSKKSSRHASKSRHGICEAAAFVDRHRRRIIIALDQFLRSGGKTADRPDRAAGVPGPPSGHRTTPVTTRCPAANDHLTTDLAQNGLLRGHSWLNVAEIPTWFGLRRRDLRTVNNIIYFTKCEQALLVRHFMAKRISVIISQKS